VTKISYRTVKDARVSRHMSTIVKGHPERVDVSAKRGGLCPQNVSP
jgi:hypothetical protein